MPVPLLPPEDLAHVLTHTRELWEDIRGARIFITGGTGFYGCWLLEAFLFANQALRLNARMVVLTRDATAFSRKAPRIVANECIEFVIGDASNFKFPSGEFSHIIHAAIDYREPLDLFNDVLNSTRHTLEFSVHAGAKRYLFASSGAVYGPQPVKLLHLMESYPGAPDTMQTRFAYGEAKRAGEWLCAAFHETSSVEPTIARGFAFVGPYLDLHRGSAIGNFIADALQGGPINVTGDGTPVRSYLYGADLAIWLWTILLRGTPCRPYNVGSDAALPIAEVARLVAEVVHPNITVHVARSSDPNAPVERYVPSTNRARSELGLEAWIDVREGIRRTVRWHKHYH